MVIEPPARAGAMRDCLRRMQFVWSHTLSGRTTLLDLLEFRSGDGLLRETNVPEFRKLLEQLIKIGIRDGFFPEKCGVRLLNAWFWFVRLTDDDAEVRKFKPKPEKGARSAAEAFKATFEDFELVNLGS